MTTSDYIIKKKNPENSHYVLGKPDMATLLRWCKIVLIGFKPLMHI